jgi:hypothetical protein
MKYQVGDKLKLINNTGIQSFGGIGDIATVVRYNSDGYIFVKWNNRKVDIVNVIAGFHEHRFELEKPPQIKYYEYNLEYPDITKQKDKEKVYNELMETFEEQLKDWIYG